MTGLLNDISILNRIDEAKDQFEKEPLNIGEIVEDMILESEQLLTDNNMEIISSIPENTIIEGNHSLIYSIFRNLIDHSIAYAGQ